MIEVMIDMVIGMMRHNFGHNVVGVSVSDVVGVVDVIGVAEVSHASDWNALGGVVDQLLCDGSWALLEECVSARGAVDMTRAVGHNVEVRRVV